MEQIFEIIKAFLKNEVNELIDAYNLTASTPLTKFADTNIVFGPIDPFKNPTQKMLCSVYPENQNDTEDDIAGQRTASQFTVTIVNKGLPYATLLSQTCAYSELILKGVTINYTLGYRVSDAAVGERKFYPDAGIAEKQATATEMQLTIYTDNDL